MTSNKVIAFFATSKGRVTSGILSAAAITTGILTNVLPNSIFLDKTREFLQLYKDGYPVPVSSAVKEKFENVKTDLKLSEEESQKLSVFTVYGFNILHIGTTHYPTGATIGIPKNFSYTTSIEEGDRRNIAVGQSSVHWSSPDGLALESSLLLSDAAMKYAIAREIFVAKSHLVTQQSAINGAAILAYYFATYSFNRKANLFARPLGIRIGFYSILGSIVFTTWMFIKDFLNYRTEDKCDEQAASISRNYAQGALEFHSKALQRNLALRSLLGSDGIKSFTASGNERETFRTKHVPLVTLRDRAMARYESLTKPTEMSEVTSVKHPPK